MLDVINNLPQEEKSALMNKYGDLVNYIDDIDDKLKACFIMDKSYHYINFKHSQNTKEIKAWAFIVAIKKHKKINELSDIHSIIDTFIEYALREFSIFASMRSSTQSLETIEHEFVDLYCDASL